MKRHATHHQARRHQELLLAGIGPAIPGREVKLQLRPQKTRGVLLEGRIPRKGPAELARAAGGQRDAERALNVKSSVAFSVSDGWRDDRVVAGEWR